MSTATIHSFSQNEVHFGFDLPAEVNKHLQQAAKVISSRKDALVSLLDARNKAPEQLEVLVALYKFYFYEGETAKAEDFVFQALIKASLQGGFAHDWENLTPQSANWNNPRGPERIFLYTLKALAFIRLRQKDPVNARSVLDALERLDPTDQVGANVIRDLLAGLEEDREDG